MRKAQRIAGVACLAFLAAAAIVTAPGCGDYDDSGDAYERDRRGDYYYEDDRGGGGSYHRDRGRYEDDYDVSNDGTRFLMITAETSGLSLVVVPNWRTELRRLTAPRNRD
jgi:hypothetical protein